MNLHIIYHFSNWQTFSEREREKERVKERKREGEIERERERELYGQQKEDRERLVATLIRLTGFSRVCVHL